MQSAWRTTLGIVRDVAVTKDGGAQVTITPTFAGCPALEMIKSSIRLKLAEIGFSRVDLQVSLSPPWSTDQILPQAKEKLRSFGLAPPPRVDGDLVKAIDWPATCPYCGSLQTQQKNPFGTTPCRSIYYCNNCLQAFERMKPL